MPNTLDEVNLVYSQLLQRAPDAAGVAFWSGRLDDGSLNDLSFRDAVRDTPEYKQVHARASSQAVAIEWVNGWESAQLGTAGQDVGPNDPYVRVTDASGKPVEGAEVFWSLNSGGVNTNPSVTDSAGLAGTRWHLGPLVGAQVLVATVDGANGAVNSGATVYAASPSFGAQSAPGSLSGQIATAVPITGSAIARSIDGSPSAGVGASPSVPVGNRWRMLDELKANDLTPWHPTEPTAPADLRDLASKTGAVTIGYVGGGGEVVSPDGRSRVVPGGNGGNIAGALDGFFSPVLTLHRNAPPERPSLDPLPRWGSGLLAESSSSLVGASIPASRISSAVWLAAGIAALYLFRK